MRLGEREGESCRIKTLAPSDSNAKDYSLPSCLSRPSAKAGQVQIFDASFGVSFVSILYLPEENVLSLNRIPTTTQASKC